MKPPRSAPEAPPAERHLLDPLPIHLSRPLVLLRLGYRSATQVPEKTSRLLDAVLEEARPLLAPRAICAAFPIERPGDGRLVIGGRLATASRSLAARLEGCGRAVLFAATIGPALEEWVRRLGDDGEMTRALLADAVGSSAAIALGVSLESVVTGEFQGLGLEPTKRYAPGYGDWELESQEPLMTLVDAPRIGITLSPDCLMLPAKSISGVIGGRG
jgi:cobalamin-dependent methionine synthase I